MELEIRQGFISRLTDPPCEPAEASVPGRVPRYLGSELGVGLTRSMKFSASYSGSEVEGEVLW
jgi:hypothetical protein